MSDDAAKHFDAQQAKTPGSPEQIVTLTITWHLSQSAQQQIEYSFPSNEMMAYALLEKARAKLDELGLLRQVQQAQAARGGLGGFVKRMNGGR